jgi:hypothetical protein
VNAFAWISTVVGTLFAAGIALALKTRHASRTAVRVRAKIVGQKSRYLLRPRYDGMLVRVTRFLVDVPRPGLPPVQLWLPESIGDALIDKLVGESGALPVFHPVGQPERARVDSRATRYIVAAYLCAPGVLWALLLCYIAIAY